MDISVAQHAPVAKPIIHTVVKMVPVGVTYMNAILASVVSLAAGFGMGWYIKGRGLTGAKIDATNAVTAVEKIPAEVKAAV